MIKSKYFISPHPQAGKEKGTLLGVVQELSLLGSKLVAIRSSFAHRSQVAIRRARVVEEARNVTLQRGVDELLVVQADERVLQGGKGGGQPPRDTIRAMFSAVPKAIGLPTSLEPPVFSLRFVSIPICIISKRFMAYTVEHHREILCISRTHRNLSLTILR